MIHCLSFYLEYKFLARLQKYEHNIDRNKYTNVCTFGIGRSSLTSILQKLHNSIHNKSWICSGNKTCKRSYLIEYIYHLDGIEKVNCPFLL